MDDLTRLLADLVSIPSVNPMGRALAGPEVLETRLTGYLEDWFGDTGSPAAGSRSRPAATTCSRRFESPGSRRTLLFDVHQDTVPTDGMTIDPFRPRIEDGRMWGRGSCDIKGGMAAMLVALRSGFAASGRPGPPRSCWPARWTRNSPIRELATGPNGPWRGPGHRRRADTSGPGSLPQRGIALEDPNPGRGLP